MKSIFYLCTICLIQTSLSAQTQYLKLDYTTEPYLELENSIVLCQDSIGLRHHFTLDVPMEILGEEVDSFYIFNWSNLHLALGNKKSKECDLFVPINTGLRREINEEDSIGFSISYEITGEIGHRVIKVQWKNVKPLQTAEDHDRYNVQMIIDEKDGSVSYHFGEMPPFINTLFSLFFQDRNLALYFIDDFKSLSSPKNEIYYVGQNWHDDSIIEIEIFKLLNSKFSDEAHSVYMHYDHTGADLQSGYLFTFSVLDPLQNEEIFPVVYRTYPNPASTELYILSQEPIKTYYEIFDITGVSEQRGIIENNTINIEQLSPGLHLLKWSTAQGEVYINRFVKL